MLEIQEKFLLREALKIECLNTLVHCEGGEQNLNLAMEYIGELLSSSSCNLRYAELDLLYIVIQHYEIGLTSEQQKVILTCLEHADSAVKLKALRLLCVAAKERNVDMVCSQVADNAHSCCGDNVHLRAELVKEAIVLTDKFPNTNNFWHVAMLIRLLPLGNQMQMKLIQKRIKAVLSSESVQNIVQARHKVLQILRKYSGSKTASTSVLEMFVWTLSHFGIKCSNGDSECSIHEIVQLGKKVIKHQIAKTYLSPDIERLLVTINDALSHIIYQYGVYPDIVDYIQEVKSLAVNNSYLHKYCLEILHEVPHSQELHRCLKDMDWYKEVKRVDLTLSFLDWYVCESLKRGENLYHPKHSKIVDTDGSISIVGPECFLYQGINSIRDSSDICRSPVSSEKESCFGSFSSEEMKFYPVMKSVDKEATEPRIVWTKTGRMQDDVKTDAMSEIEQVPSVGITKGSHENVFKLFVNTGDKDKDNGNERENPLENLLGEDFQKLYVNTEKN